jgi:signal transduction histidine kinase/CheY-like chemotaxis protein
MAEKRLHFHLSLLAFLLWTIAIGASLFWNLHSAKLQMDEMAYAEAKANLNKDITFRRWGTMHGGVYVPITENQQSIPWLSHVPGRDVTTSDGRKLTLLNPASMLRQMMDLYAQDYGVRGRIVGLKYLNPGNAPDDWEKKQLESFERGEKKDVWEVSDIDGKPYLRYLRVMMMEPGCDKCHAILGYKTGEMRGATGLNLPLDPYVEQLAKSQRNLILPHLVIWLLGLGGIAVVWWLLARWAAERAQAQAELVQHRDHLESLVAERTAALTLSMRAAEAANLAKSAFLANMSHEIRTPLNAITGMAYLIKQGGVTPKQAERLNIIDTAGRHLLEIINAVLDLAKIEAGKFVLDETSLSIGAVVGNVTSMLDERAKAKNLQLTSYIGSFPGNLVGDPIRLQQALLNYATNAIKFTEAGTIALRASMVEEDNDSALIRFEVEDTGIGIAQADIEKLFSEFEQVDSSNTRQYGGTGLGLAITRRIAQVMGGDAGVTSEVGAGSTFWFTARLRKASTTAKNVAAVNIGSVTDLLVRGFSRSRILIAEDDSANLDIARTLLEEVGMQVDVATDGAQAIEMAKSHGYDLILMDIQMPQVDGFQACRTIREISGHERTPIVALTANAFEEDRNKCMAAGMNDFVAKPVSPEVLYAVVLRNLQQSVLAGMPPA